MPWKIITAMFLISILTITAIIKGIDGAALATGCSLIAGLAGFSIGKATKSQRPPS